MFHDPWWQLRNEHSLHFQMFKKGENRLFLLVLSFERFMPQEVVRLLHGVQSVSRALSSGRGPGLPLQHLLPGSQGPSHSGPVQWSGFGAAEDGQSLWLLEVKRERGHCYKPLEARQSGLGQGEKPRGGGLALWPLDTFASTGTWINSEFRHPGPSPRSQRGAWLFHAKQYSAPCQSHREVSPVTGSMRGQPEVDE